MNSSFVLGLFALYVVGVSLCGILSGSSDDCLAMVRKHWGRMQGLIFFFCLQVALPMLIGIVFVSWGIANINLPGSPLDGQRRAAAVLEIDWQAIQQMQKATEEAITPKIYLPIPLCA